MSFTAEGYPEFGCSSCDAKDAEIERLKAAGHDQALTISSLKSLIVDMADELDFWERSEGFIWGMPELKQRSREATK